MVYSVQQTTFASYFVAWWIVKQKEPHTIGEELVKPAAVDMVRTICGGRPGRSNRSLCRMIRFVRYDMSNDIKQQVITASGKFSLQLDESTDVTDDAQLMAYAR